MRLSQLGLLAIVATALGPQAVEAVELGSITGLNSTFAVSTQLVSLPSEAMWSAGTFQQVSQPLATSSDTSGNGFQSAGGILLSAGALTINIAPTTALASNAAALAAFQRAGMQWARRIQDPITVTISADLANLGSTTIIGQASTTMRAYSYSTIRDAMVADAANETDDGIVASLPIVTDFSAWIPDGFGLTGSILASNANLKALGLAGLDSAYDATITFNSGFAFDYDNSDGVTTGTMDFETVAAHEIGHALGFMSVVDSVDYWLSQGVSGAFSFYTMDLFRFANDVAGSDPANAEDFSTFPRYLMPGGDAITDWIDAAWGVGWIGAEARMSTGAYRGDGSQASHWKDGYVTGQHIGIMNPTVADETIVPVGEADLRALDLIGYDIAPLEAVPEPQSLAIALVGLLGLAVARRRASAQD